MKEARNTRQSGSGNDLIIEIGAVEGGTEHEAIRKWY